MSEIGIRKTHEKLKEKLSNYIKAQYFAENDLLLSATNELLNKRGILYQEPYIEATKSYDITKDGFAGSDLPKNIKEYLLMLIELGLGVFSTPFVHQVNALEEFYKGKDLLVTTGTGSGKTECFIWPILTEIIREASTTPQTWEMEGIRTLILYPMNALVSDQLGRIRNIIGRKDDAYMKTLVSFSNESVRRPRFGMYTGRTPYAGENSLDKNKNLAKLISDNYLNCSSNVYDELLKIGRVPSKNLHAFVERLKKDIQIPSPDDSELYTRGEMQSICPDILVTNYCMLEYMLMRQIETCFWDKTIDWLRCSNDNKLLLVIDEAHMYRGASGGEVALLIRRLMDKLQIGRDKIKCILTSASVPDGKEKELRLFACGLTGQEIKRDNFSIIRGKSEEIKHNAKGSQKDIENLLRINYEKLQGDEIDLKAQLEILSGLFGWPKLKDNIKEWLYENLSKYPPMLELIHCCSGKGIEFSKLSSHIFESVSQKEAEKATEILLLLGTMAKSVQGKVLLPSRAHLMFRGLNGIFACINPQCKHNYDVMGIKLGNIDENLNFTCNLCGSRVYELYADRRCGTLFIRAFKDERDSEGFLWQKESKLLFEPKEIHLWIVPKDRKDIFKNDSENKKQIEKSKFAYIECKTGILFDNDKYENHDGFIKVLKPTEYDKVKRAYTFTVCPNCGREKTKLTPFRTRGNEPFANIVKEQLEAQAAKDVKLKNKGKKVLLFSDSRQRAATLARDITIASDRDAGRQALFVASKLLESKYGRGAVPLNLLYYAFLKVVYDNKLSFFYGDEKDGFKSQLVKYVELYSDKENPRYNKMEGYIGKPPNMFYQLLLKNISDSFRSFHDLCLGQVILIEDGEEGEELEEDILEKVAKMTSISMNLIRDIYNTWIQHLIVNDIAVFPEVEDSIRSSILSYEKGAFGIDEKGKFPKYLQKLLKKNDIKEEQILILREKFDLIADVSKSAEDCNNRKYILPMRLTFKTNENGEWYRCNRCSGTSMYTLFGSCIYCGSDGYLSIAKEHELSRYAFWRQPVIDAVMGKEIKNTTTEEHTAQLSHKDQRKKIFVTTEEHEMRFRDIMINSDEEPIDILSCTTTMEVGIDIGSLTAVGLRNVPPMRENYQQRSGRAGRKGTAVSTIVTYTEDGPHDSWYFKEPDEIIAGEPRIPWIDTNNIRLVYRHLNLIFLQEYFLKNHASLDTFDTLGFFSLESALNYKFFLDWLEKMVPIDGKRIKTLIPDKVSINWDEYIKEIAKNMKELNAKTNANPIIYTKKKSTDDSEVPENTMLMDALFSEGFLPTYSFPRNIIHFWIEDKYGDIAESPERSIDLSLSEYAPGRIIVVNKKSYISGAIYDHYTKFDKNHRFTAAEPWLEISEFNKDIYCCKNKNCGWFGVKNDGLTCPLCNETVEKHKFIKPWGFAPRNGVSIPETRDTQEYSAVSIPSYSSMPQDLSNMKVITKTGLVRMETREKQLLVMINKGPDDEGFDLCSKCGAIEPANNLEDDKRKRKRPYKVPFVKNDSQLCSHTRENIFLGHEINTDMLVLEIKLESDKIDILPEMLNVWVIPAITTFSEALALSASKVLDIEFSDLKCGYRLRYSHDCIYADVYLYDSLSSGAGYSTRVAELIDTVLDGIEKRLKNCNCDTACPNCIQHFWNQKVKESLDKVSAIQLLGWIRDGKIESHLPISMQKSYLDILDKIIKLQQGDEYGYEESSDGEFFIKMNERKKRVVVYPAMCSKNLINGSKDTIFIPDRLFKVAIPYVWKLVREQFFK